MVSLKCNSSFDGKCKSLQANFTSQINNAVKLSHTRSAKSERPAALIKLKEQILY